MDMKVEKLLTVAGIMAAGIDLYWVGFYLGVQMASSCQNGFLIRKESDIGSGVYEVLYAKMNLDGSLIWLVDWKEATVFTEQSAALVGNLLSESFQNAATPPEIVIISYADVAFIQDVTTGGVQNV